MAPVAKLLYHTPDGQDHEVVLRADGEVIIGRHPACGIHISKRSISRRHARFTCADGGFIVEDLGSSNGTWLNDQRVERAALSPGDRIRCGDFTLEFRESSSDAKPRIVGSLRPRQRNAPISATPPPTHDISAPPPAKLPKQTAPAKPMPKKKPRPKPPPTPSAASVPPARGDELEQLRAEAEFWKAQAEAQALLTESASRESAAVDPKHAARLAELERDLDDRARRIEELEQATRRGEEQVETLSEKALRLKAQVQAQQGQIEAASQERQALELALVQARDRAATLEDAHQATGDREHGLADEVNDLKREVRQRDKQLSELEKSLDLAEYNLNAAREENENLRLALGEDDSARQTQGQTIDHLRQVLSEKEAMLEGLQADLDRLQRQGSGDGEVDELRRERDAAFAKLQAMSKELVGRQAAVEQLTDLLNEERAAGPPGSSRKLMSQVNTLKRRNRELKHQVDRLEASGGGDPQAAELLSRAAEQQRAADERVRDLEAALAKLRRSAEGALGGSAGPLLQDAIRLYESINDIASELRTNVSVAVDYVEELQPLVALVERAPLASLPPDWSESLRAAIEEADARYTIDSAADVLKQAREASDGLKRSLRAFRKTLNKHGYGS